MIGSRLAAAGLAAAGLAIAWRVAALGLAGFFAGDDAGLALRFDPRQPDALVRLAGEDISEDRAAQAEARARLALQARPLNAPAFRALGFAAYDQGDEAKADAMMAASARLSRRELPANAWMFNKAVAEKNYPAAFRYADALLRRAPEYSDRLFPEMIATLDDPAAIEALSRRLARAAPVWRGSFLADLAGQGSEGAIRAVLRRIQASRRPLSDQEMAWVLRRYLALHDRREVRSFWADLLPPADRARVAQVYDGGFETGAGQAMFGWVEARSASAATRFEETQDSAGKALHAEHFGPKKARILSQMLLLDPGPWRLVGRAKAEGGSEADALSWTVSCGAGGSLGSAAIGDQTEWRPFETTFTVPAGCASQTLSLEVRPQGGGGVSAWFDDLRIERPGAGT